jgi:hypothetical protein
LLGELGRILEYLREAETLAEVLNDQPRLGQISVYTVQHCGKIDDYDRAIACGQCALALMALARLAAAQKKGLTFR